MASSHFRPTLLVGVGGTGCEIVERVYTQALGTEIGRTGKIVVMGFDTDDNDMRRLNAIERVNRIRFSSPETVGEMTRKYRELIAPWFFDPPDALPEGIKKMTLFDGAAQIRMFTHLGLFTQLTSGTIPQRIGNALASLGRYDNADSYDGVVNVMMVGSLAGATGSGSFIQLALLIQREARSRGVQADVRGLFLMPDVYVYGASLPVTQIPNVLSNGYASLRELNAVNSLASGETDAANLQYEYAPGHLVGQGDFPFYSVTLMDFETSGGGSLGQSVDSYKSMAKRAVYQQIFSPIGGRVRSIETNDARAKFAAAAMLARLHFAAQLLAHHLLAITNAKDRDTSFKKNVWRARRPFIGYAGRGAGEDNALGLHPVKGSFGHAEGRDFGINACLAHTARDQLRHLTAKIDDKDGIGEVVLVHGAQQWRWLARVSSVRTASLRNCGSRAAMLLQNPPPFCCKKLMTHQIYVI